VADNAIRDIASRREQDDRYPAPFPDVATNLETVSPRKHQVEDYKKGMAILINAAEYRHLFDEVNLCNGL
jgi:hypothetical protein